MATVSTTYEQFSQLVKPVLHKYAFRDDSNEIKEQFESEFSVVESNPLFNQDFVVDVFRFVLFEHFSQSIFTSQNTTITATDSSHHTLQKNGIFNLLRFSRQLFSEKEGRKAVNETLTINLLIDVIEACTITQLEELFDQLQGDEQLISYLSAKCEKQKNALSLVAALNKVLEVTSKTHNNKLRGSVLRFMALCFPLDDRSAVNLIASVNTSHETKPETATEDDNRLYTIFWSIQKWLQNPRENIADLTETDRREFGQFLFSLEQILKCFAEKLMVINATGDIENENELKDEFFVCKYLTNKSLFELQLSDAMFRRQILVQILMAIYSVTLTNNFAADRTSKMKATMSAEGQNKLKLVQDKCLDMLKRESPLFAKRLNQLLERETNYAQWKWLNKCAKLVRKMNSKQHAFSRSVSSSKFTTSLNTMAKTKDKMRVMRDNDPADIEQVLSGGNELLVKDSYDTYVKQRIIDEVTNESASKRSNHRIFKWKAMRLLSRANMMALGKISDDLKKDEEVLEDGKYDNKLQQVVYELYFPPEPPAPSTPTPLFSKKEFNPSAISTPPPPPRVNTPPPPPPFQEPEDTEMKEASTEDTVKPEPPPNPPAPPTPEKPPAQTDQQTPQNEENRKHSIKDKVDLTVETGASRKRRRSDIDQSPSSATPSSSHKKRKWNNDNNRSGDHNNNRDQQQSSSSPRQPSNNYNYNNNSSSNQDERGNNNSGGKRHYNNNKRRRDNRR